MRVLLRESCCMQAEEDMSIVLKAVKTCICTNIPCGRTFDLEYNYI